MTMLYSNDFEGVADSVIPAGWQAPGGGASNWVVRDVPSIAVNGTKSLTSPGSSPGTPAEFVGIASRTTVEYEFRQKAAINAANQYIASVAHTDNMAGNPTDFNYRFLFTATTGSVTADISPFLLGDFPGVVATGTRSMPTAAGDVIGVKVRVENKVASVWVWNDSHETCPPTPLATWTDSVQRPAGHFGCYWPGTVLVGIDQLTISDGAASGANGVANGATINGTSTLSAGAASGAGGGSATAPGATLSDTSTLTPGAASGASTGSFTSSPMENNAGSLMANVSVLWEWRKGSGIGVAPVSVTYGAGATNASGVLALSGLPLGSGELLVATPGYADVNYERGTVA